MGQFFLPNIAEKSTANTVDVKVAIRAIAFCHELCCMLFP